MVDWERSGRLPSLIRCGIDESRFRSSVLRDGGRNDISGFNRYATGKRAKRRLAVNRAVRAHADGVGVKHRGEAANM